MMGHMRDTSQLWVTEPVPTPSAPIGDGLVLRVVTEASEHSVTQLVFGGRRTTGEIDVAPGTTCGILTSETTHGARRLRSWLTIFRVPLRGERVRLPVRLPGLDRAVDLVAQVDQRKHHRKPGPVATLLTLLEEVEARGQRGDDVPAAFWRRAAATAQRGAPVEAPRLPTLRRRAMRR